MKPHSNRARLFLLPSVLGAFQSARKLLCAGDGFGHERRSALLALHRVFRAVVQGFTVFVGM